MLRLMPSRSVVPTLEGRNPYPMLLGAMPSIDGGETLARPMPMGLPFAAGLSFARWLSRSNELSTLCPLTDGGGVIGRGILSDGGDLWRVYPTTASLTCAGAAQEPRCDLRHRKRERVSG
jgi:hypothetical protein